MSHKKWSEIDVLYSIGTILVILGHSHSSDWSTFAGTILNPLNTFIYTFHMPLFFFVAGFLFWNSTSLEKIGYGKWLKNKTVRLLTPYIVLSLIAFVPKYYVENHGFDGLTPNYIFEIIFVPRSSVWGHFWFLPTLLLLYVFWGFSKRFFPRKETLVFWVIFSVVSIFLYFFPYSTNWFCFDDFKQAFIFFFFGMITNQTIKDKPRTAYTPYRIAWIIIGTLFSVFSSIYFNQNKIMLLLTAIVMISVCWQIAVLVGQNKITKWISENNFTIYIYSWPVQSVVMILAEKLGFPWYSTTLSMFSAGICVPVLIALVYKKFSRLNNRFLDLLVGAK